MKALRRDGRETGATKPQARGESGNRFARRPGMTLGIVSTLLLLASLVTMELLLRTFTGLGNPVLYELNPLYGYRPLPDQVIEPKGGAGFLKAARVATNNLGLRAAGDWSSDPARKILFLGDSVTYGGQYIADRQLFSSVAGRGLPGWQVGNGGVNAWGVENIVGLVVDSGFSPAEVVVTCLIEGDFYRGTTRAASVPLWVERPRFALQDLLLHLVWRVHESRYGSSVDLPVMGEEGQDRVVERAARRLRELDDHLKRRRVRHYLFLLPTRGQVVDGEPPDARVRRALARHGLEPLDLLPETRAWEPDEQGRRAWFHDIVHLEAPGHEAYGTLIGKVLSQTLTRR